jgi:hypothetical protein
MQSLETRANNENKIDVLNEKIATAVSKIDTLLDDDRISNKSTYLLLKIKKAFISFLYL